jgi:hypothetical protein
LSSTPLEKLGYAALILALPLAGVAIFASATCSDLNMVLACGLAALLICTFGAILNALEIRRARSAAITLACLILCGAVAASLLNVLSDTIVVDSPRC